MPRRPNNIKKILTSKGIMREQIKAYWILQELKICCKSINFESTAQSTFITNKIDELSNMIYEDIMIELK